VSTVLIAVLSFLGFIVAYRTYGRWLGRKIFRLDDARPTPAETLNDGCDYVPSRRGLVFGHHFTSIAGTGPIVGPAIAVFWGWLPALLWVVFGSIFIGAVHDFGALAVSLRNEGQSIGEIAGRVIHRRARLLMLMILLLELTIVLAVFGLVIAVVFKLYRGAVPAVWISLPIAVGIGLWSHRKGTHLLLPALLALAAIYMTIGWGQNHTFDVQAFLGLSPDPQAGPPNPWFDPIVLWTVILFVYCFVASVLPVWLLLQPRDYVNSLMLFVAVGLVVAGMFVAGVDGRANLFQAAPAVASAEEIPADAPPIFPFLFITVACGAVSGFHSLVSSGTSSKQLRKETDALPVGYGSMLLEGALAVVVILACTAGVGMGLLEHDGTQYAPALDAQGQPVVGEEAWHGKYPLAIDPLTHRNTTRWATFGLPKTVGAFAEGGANFLHAIGIPLHFAVLMLGVMVACFATTTLDTATRLQRYVVQELGQTLRVRPLTNKYIATALACGGGLGLALLAGNAPGKGGMILWPIFGATNQLLAGLGFCVVAFFLLRRGREVWFLVVPALLMLGLPAWAMLHEMFGVDGWLAKGEYLLLGMGGATQVLMLWMLLEAALAWRNAKREGRTAIAENTPPDAVVQDSTKDPS
jgi:carbon starvation protein